MFLILSSSPNSDGLTAACVKAAQKGFAEARKECVHIDLGEDRPEACRVCRDGWGQCRQIGRCVIGDCLHTVQNTIEDSSGIFLITPVYFWGPSELMLYLLTRLRRCEAFAGDRSRTRGKYFSLVAAAGGSGNGTVKALAWLEDFCQHTDAIAADRIGVTRFNQQGALDLVYDAAKRMAEGKIVES